MCRGYEMFPEWLTFIQTGGKGGRKVPALSWNAYNFFDIQPIAAKLYDVI